jgi:hypothetical protein
MVNQRGSIERAPSDESRYLLAGERIFAIPRHHEIAQGILNAVLPNVQGDATLEILRSTGRPSLGTQKPKPFIAEVLT